MNELIQYNLVKIGPKNKMYIVDMRYTADRYFNGKVFSMLNGVSEKNVRYKENDIVCSFNVPEKIMRTYFNRYLTLDEFNIANEKIRIELVEYFI